MRLGPELPAVGSRRGTAPEARPLAASIRDIVATAPHRRPQGFVAFNNYV
ncbi:hypothetical protein [Micromonospora zhanjiangensis]